MPSVDFRVSASFLDHPKLSKLKRRLGPEGVLHVLALWSFAAVNAPTGDFGDMTIEDIEIASRWSGEPGELVRTLVELKLVDEDSGQYRIHDWADHNSFIATFPERSRQAREAIRSRWAQRGAAAADPSNTSRIETVDTVRNSERITPSPIPDPSPTAIPYRKDEAAHSLTEPGSKPKKPEYPADFERAMALYPPRPEGDSKPAAFKAWRARIAEGISAPDLIAGVERYARYITKSGSLIKQAATFFGPSEFWKQPWGVPANTNGNGTIHRNGAVRSSTPSAAELAEHDRRREGLA